MNNAFQYSSPDDSEKTLLRVEGICKRFGEIPALDRVTFTLNKKEILGIIGPSGGGKSTLLRCIDFLEGIDKGRIELNMQPNSLILDSNGISLSGTNNDAGYMDSAIEPHLWRKHIGLVFQSFNLWEERTVLYNLILAPMVVLGFTRERAEQTAVELSRQFDIGNKLYSKAWQLSGGQKQRVAIIRALMMEPNIMLLDEVTSALDPVLTVGVMEAISSLKDRGITMVVVSHHLEFISSLCDRAIFLAQGRIVQIDQPAILKQIPANYEVAKFLAVLRAAR